MDKKLNNIAFWIFIKDCGISYISLIYGWKYYKGVFYEHFTDEKHSHYKKAKIILRRRKLKRLNRRSRVFGWMRLQL